MTTLTRTDALREIIHEDWRHDVFMPAETQHYSELEGDDEDLFEETVEEVLDFMRANDITDLSIGYEKYCDDLWAKTSPRT